MKQIIEKNTNYYGIIYKTTNLINNKCYIGQSKYNKPNYLGSGLLIKKAIKKYGESNFLKEILEYCYSKKELNEREIYWIKIYKNPITCYNITKGGEGGLGAKPGKENHRYGIKRTEESKIKQSKSLKKYYKDNPQQKYEHTKHFIGASYRIGAKNSESSKKKLRENAKNNSNYGMKGKTKSRESILRGIETRKKNKSCEGSSNGRYIFVDESIIKEIINLYSNYKYSYASFMLLIKEQYNVGKRPLSRILKENNVIIRKTFSISEATRENYRKASKKRDISGEKNPCYGTKYEFYNNGIKNKRCTVDNKESLILQGYIKGRLPFKTKQNDKGEINIEDDQ